MIDKRQKWVRLKYLVWGGVVVEADRNGVWQPWTPFWKEGRPNFEAIATIEALMAADPLMIRKPDHDLDGLIPHGPTEPRARDEGRPVTQRNRKRRSSVRNGVALPDDIRDCGQSGS